MILCNSTWPTASTNQKSNIVQRFAIVTHQIRLAFEKLLYAYIAR